MKKVQLKMRQLETTKVKDLQRKVHEQEQTIEELNNRIRAITSDYQTGMGRTPMQQSTKFKGSQFNPLSA